MTVAASVVERRSDGVLEDEVGFRGRRLRVRDGGQQGKDKVTPRHEDKFMLSQNMGRECTRMHAYMECDRIYFNANDWFL
jgi:hypothetical protein